MAKIARTPYNGARWATKKISSDTMLTRELTGQCIFVNAEEDLEITVNFIDKGSYFKVIMREDTAGSVKFIFPKMEGIVLSDDGSTLVLTNAGEQDETTLNLGAGASAGSYIDLICDGDKWYVTGMAHGVHWTQE